MYENMTYEFIENRVLSRVSPKFDKREGSIIFDATAPVSFELAEAYIMARVILNETFATTASREYLIMRASEFNIYPEEATFAEMEGKFSKSIPIGSRFNYENYNFTATELLDDSEHTYKLVCETAGVGGNTCIGDINPIGNLGGLETAKITKIIRPGEDEEDTEVFRQRYIEALKSKAYGGNGADYKEKALAQAGVGGVKVYRCWNGGGTVKVVILTTQFEVPSDELIQELQTIFDPPPQGKGYGIAPIGHVVTVDKVKTLPINVAATVALKSGLLSDIQSTVETKIKQYLLERAKEWATQKDTESLIVRSSFILANLLEISTIADITSISVNGDTSITLDTDTIPIIGTVTLRGA